MKTKTNKVPLVGPKGRKELLDRIEELEKKVTELTNAGVTKSVVEMIDSVKDGTLEEALAALTIDGEPATYEKIHALEIGQFIIQRERLGQTEFYEPTFIERGNSFVKIAGGYVITSDDVQMVAAILLDTATGAENIAYVYEI